MSTVVWPPAVRPRQSLCKCSVFNEAEKEQRQCSANVQSLEEGGGGYPGMGLLLTRCRVHEGDSRGEEAVPEPAGPGTD